MATANAIRKNSCSICKKGKATTKCYGCSEDFCFNHLVEHRQALSVRFEDLENKRNCFRQMLSEHTQNPQNHSLIQQINQWENDSVIRIRKTAEEARELLLKNSDEHIGKIEVHLNQLTDKLKEIRQENDFNEIDLKQLEDQLKDLEEKFNKPANIAIKQDSSAFIQKLSDYMSSRNKLSLIRLTSITTAIRWVQDGITVAGGNGAGDELHQLRDPYGIYVDDEQTIYVADQSNHRIVKWRKDAVRGEIIAGGNQQGAAVNQLNWPTNIAVDKQTGYITISDTGNRRLVRWPLKVSRSGQIIKSDVGCRGLAYDSQGHLYVSDAYKHEVRRYKIGETRGILVAGGNGQGSRLNQLNDPSFIFVDEEQSVYVSESGNHRITKWVKNANEGSIVAGGHGQGNSLKQLSYPRGLTVHPMGTVYIADSGKNYIMSWREGAGESEIVVGGNDCRNRTSLFNVPTDLCFDAENNLYVVDCDNHRVLKFRVDYRDAN